MTQQHIVIIYSSREYIPLAAGIKPAVCNDSWHLTNFHNFGKIVDCCLASNNSVNWSFGVFANNLWRVFRKKMMHLIPILHHLGPIMWRKNVAWITYRSSCKDTLGLMTRCYLFFVILRCHWVCRTKEWVDPHYKSLKLHPTRLWQFDYGFHTRVKTFYERFPD